MMNQELNLLKTNLYPIIFGGASLSGEGGGYGFGAMSEVEAQNLILSAWEHGIHLFDTAPIYGFGLSEERLGKYLPKQAMVISKSGVDWHQNRRVNMTNSKEVTLKMLEESLKRLKRDCIDLYMIHWPDAIIDIREPLEILIKAKKEGKIKYIGLCNTNSSDLLKAQEMVQIDALQSELNLFNQFSFQNLDQDWKKFFTMGWGTFDKGILTGRVYKERNFSKEDCRSWAPWWNKKEVEKKIERVEKLKMILKDYNINLSNFCIQYSLMFFGLSACLVGFKKTQDIVEVNLNLQTEIKKGIMEEVLNRWHHQ